MSSESGMNTHQICQQLGLCDEWMDEEFEGKHVWDPELVDTINNDADSSWTAELSKQFKGMTLAHFRRTKLGTVVDPDHVYKLKFKRDPSKKALAALPTDFSTIKQWAYCADTTGHIRDQSSCGSCWAFGSTEAFNDRLCISNVTGSDAFAQLLSVEDTTACCSGVSCGFSNGCTKVNQPQHGNGLKLRDVRQAEIIQMKGRRTLVSLIAYHHALIT
eukprot:TRINITY_DN8751_c0_g1_i1.p1 TRINITY_DN8751_c0_g1~~TRINITY_DN8751_c0_g1_i1.p1  ORF type:complete len:217 (-),score=-1.87 TRINITY_DN8751_c0_g1_i1:54-704(-)